MSHVLLIHAGLIPHYRIPVYNYLSSYLKNCGFSFAVISDGIQSDNPHAVRFEFTALPLSTSSIARFIRGHRTDIIIDYMELRHRYLFPTYLVAKILMGKKMIYWGQGLDLADPNAPIKNLAYFLEQGMCDAIILYAEHLKKYLPERFHKKTFVANNTLNNDYPGLPEGATRESILSQYGIKTKKNIICMGRMQKRKRIEILVEAFKYMGRKDIGLILVGPDTDGILASIKGTNIYKLGPIYGDRKFELLTASDVYCLPGAVGLSIIDAFHCSLPFVTEEGDESAEIMYLKSGVNGFIVPRGNIEEMAAKLLFLMDNDPARTEFSSAAKTEILQNGSMDKMCAGFRDALFYVAGAKNHHAANAV
ncbi:MAG: Glycosyl transferases group 1 [Syntrophus sp. PtaU1.Bin005]|jgi:glycosyltransferase involved in cell wall biosynthesis|nr:MAG: Glycosyl transferases group 1 [Syntrophus sp. PtaU1.Bin005]